MVAPRSGARKLPHGGTPSRRSGYPRPCSALTHLIPSLGDVDHRNGKLAGQGGSRGYSGTEGNPDSAEGSLSRRPERGDDHLGGRGPSRERRGELFCSDWSSNG